MVIFHSYVSHYQRVYLVDVPLPFLNSDRLTVSQFPPNFTTAVRRCFTVPLFRSTSAEMTQVSLRALGGFLEKLDLLGVRAKLKKYPLVMTNIAMENRLFIDGLYTY